MKTVLIIVSLVVLLISCTTETSTRSNSVNNSIKSKKSTYLIYDKFELDGVTYYWVYYRGYYDSGQVVCPDRDKKLMN